MPAKTQHKVFEVGKAMLVFLVIVMVLRVTSYFMVSESATITRIFKVFLRILLTLICYVQCRRMRRRLPGVQFTYKNIPALFFYLMYLFLGIASLLWTTSVGFSSLQLIMDIECVAFVFFYYRLMLYSQEAAREGVDFSISRILGVSIYLILIVFIIGMFIDPEKFYRSTHGGAVSRLGGFIINPNELGMLIVVGAAGVYLQMLKMGTKFWHILAIAVLVYTLVLTGSRSSMISFFGVTGYFVMTKGSIRIKLASVLAGIAAVPFVIEEVFIKEGDVGEVMSMTGRLPFWTDLLMYGFPKRPLLGYGFMRISEGDKFESLHAYDGAMTHNTFMQVLMNLGLVGAFVVIAQMVFTFRAFFREKSQELKQTFVGVYIPIIVNSFTEFGIFGETNYGIMFYLILIIMLVLYVDHEGGTQRPVWKHG